MSGPYATQTDLTNSGFPAAAIGNLTTAQVAACLQQASDLADSYFRARWGSAAVPLTAWDTSVTSACVKIAALLVMRTRGYSAQSLADSNFQKGYDEAVTWLRDVQRQQAHPNVTLANETTGPNPGARLQQPAVSSFSVVDLSSGSTAPNRGW